MDETKEKESAAGTGAGTAETAKAADSAQGTGGEEPQTQAAPGGKDAEESSPAEQMAKDLERLQNELKEAKDTYLRMLAEYDNFRRRTAKEKEGVWNDAVAETVKGLLPIADNLERAAGAAGDADAIAAGLGMTMTALNDYLGKLGLTAFGAAGEAFDPNLHNAVMHVEDDSLGEGVIAEVFQRGYRLGDKVIRFAMVKVAN